MRRLAILLSLLLGACSTPPEPLPSAETPAPAITASPTAAIAETPAAPEPAPAAAQPQPAPAESPQQPAAPRQLRITAVGDIMLDGSMREFVRQHGYDYPFAAVDELIRSDLLIGNLEGPLTRRGQPLTPKKYLFRSPPSVVAGALARAGFGAVSLANNHTLDYGYEGLDDTLAALDAAGVSHFGAGADLAAARRGVILEVKGQRVGLLGYSNTYPEEFWAGRERPGTAFGHAHQVRADVRRLRSSSDLVIVSFHWGQEKKTRLRGYQPMLARTAIDAGAALVIGHHPHILQAVERYRDGLILYSLGNFTFGSWSPSARDSAVAIVEFSDGKPSRLEMAPIDVFNRRVRFQPRPLRGEAADAVVAELQRLSAAQGTALEARDGRAVIEWKHP